MARKPPSEPPAGIIIGSPEFAIVQEPELQARVALLETSLNELRRQMSAMVVGIGHNRGPEFELASADELNDRRRTVRRRQLDRPIGT